MRRFVETYKGYDIYLKTNEEMTAGSSCYEIVDKRLKITYTVYGGFHAVKEIIDEMTREWILKVEGIQ